MHQCKNVHSDFIRRKSLKYGDKKPTTTYKLQNADMTPYLRLTIKSFSRQIFNPETPNFCSHFVNSLTFPGFLTTHTHTHTFNGPFSGTTQVSRYQKGKTNLDFIEARDSEWQWHQLEHMQVCTSLQTDNYASTPLLSFLQAAAQPTASEH